MFKIRRSLKTRSIKQVDSVRRDFLVNAVKVLSAIGAAFAVVPFVSSLSPNRKILHANQPLHVDVSNIQPGTQMTVIWRGKPIWIIHRTPQQLKLIEAYNPSLRDPDSLTNQQPEFAKNIYRSSNPKYLVLVGLCTHLGCSPKFENANKPDKPPGFYCPCHGSRFDLSGRVYKKMPAPINLEVPPYYFLNDNILVIGEEHG